MILNTNDNNITNVLNIFVTPLFKKNTYFYIILHFKGTVESVDSFTNNCKKNDKSYSIVILSEN